MSPPAPGTSAYWPIVGNRARLAACILSITLAGGSANAEREWWTNYHQIVNEASPEFTGPKTRSDDPCLVYFISGTVGYPKMVLHTHTSYPIGHTITGKYWLDLHEDDLHWNLSEMGWLITAIDWLADLASFFSYSGHLFDTDQLLTKDGQDDAWLEQR